MIWLFPALHLVALVSLIWKRFPYRWFLIALALWTIQLVNVNLGKTAHWVETGWRYPEMALLLATVACCAETGSSGWLCVTRPFHRLQIAVAAMAIPACIVGTGAYFLSKPQAFVNIRMWIWWYLALFLIVSEMLLKLMNIARPWLLATHSGLLLTVMLCHAVASPFTQVSPIVWFMIHDITRVSIGACCLAWAILPVIVCPGPQVPLGAPLLVSLPRVDGPGHA